MNICSVSELGEQALEAGLLLRLKISRPLGLWMLRLVVAEHLEPNKVRILGEMKAWAYKGVHGLQLDTIRVLPEVSGGVGYLVWAATMAWALESTPCKTARLLAICDDEYRHACLVRYFSIRGFKLIREVGSAPIDLPLRMVWGGSGSLMVGDCNDVFHRNIRLWRNFNQLSSCD